MKRYLLAGGIALALLVAIGASSIHTSDYSGRGAVNRIATGWPAHYSYEFEWADAESRNDTVIVSNSLHCRQWRLVGPVIAASYDKPIHVVYTDASGHRDSLWFPDKYLYNHANGTPGQAQTPWTPSIIDTFIVAGTDSFNYLRIEVVGD